MTTIETYPDGAYIERYEGGYRYVSASDESMTRTFYRPRSQTDHLLEAELWAQFDQQFGATIESEDAVPLTVAVAGRPAIAAWLNVAHQYSASEIAEHMGVSERTVRQYFSDFRRGRRQGKRQRT